jgi:thiol:disulfide interchange protein
MKRSIVLFACLALLCLASSALGQDTKGKDDPKAGGTDGATLTATPQVTGKASADESKYAPVLEYDPARNAEQDIQDAVAEAKRTNRRVMVEVGGDWCIWCHHMDEFFEKHPDMLAQRDKNFVMVKVNRSDENKNEELLSRYPKVAGYPHIFILDKDGKLIHSQDTGLLEEGKGYNPDKFKTFLTVWATAASDIAQK